MSIYRKINDKIRDWVGGSYGTAGETYTAGVREPRPYSAYYSDGIFEGNDGTLWIYFKMPEDVKVEWTKTYRGAAENQQFLTDIFNKLGDSIDENVESTRKDLRIKFHIPIIREMQDELSGFPESTVMMDDFIDRMSQTVRAHPVWHSYLGIEVLPGDINADVYGFSDKVRNYVDHITRKTDFKVNLYKEYLNLIRMVCIDNGMRPLDFSIDHEDFDRLVGWFGETDVKYDIRPELPTTILRVPSHGKSIFAGNREIMMSSIRPREAKDMGIKDPFDAAMVRFGEILLRPNLDIVHINIRGEIRSNIAAANMLEDKVDRAESSEMYDMEKDLNTSASDRKRLARDKSMAGFAAEVANSGHSLLDNVEMTVATIVTKGESQLNKALKPAQLEAVNITARQQYALASTVPAYPDPIYVVSAGNSKRNPNVRTFFSGVLSMSGLFQSTKPAANGGIIVGLSESGYELKEIYISPTSTKQPPIINISGTTGSGKTVQMLMMCAQNSYLNKQTIMLNPKPNNSLKPFFDMLGGETINISDKYLKERPGMLDPMFFLPREKAANLLAEMITTAMALRSTHENKTKMMIAVEELKANIIGNALMEDNKTSFDVIFGNKRNGANTPPLTNKSVLKFVRLKIETSSLWKASISKDPGARNSFLELFSKGKPILIEWDDSIVLPDKKKSPHDIGGESEMDGVQSIINMFAYATDVIGSNKNGGILAIDEAYILKSSDLIMNKVIKSGRQWRARNTTLLMGSQRLSDFIGMGAELGDADLTSYVRTFIIMNIAENDNQDLDIFYKLSELPRDLENTKFITSMQRNEAAGRYIPSAYIIDKETNWDGAVMCGPWPQRELRATDPDQSSMYSQIEGTARQMQGTYEQGGLMPHAEE